MHLELSAVSLGEERYALSHRCRKLKFSFANINMALEDRCIHQTPQQSHV